MNISNATKFFIISCLLSLSCTAMAATNTQKSTKAQQYKKHHKKLLKKQSKNPTRYIKRTPNITEYQVIEIKEGEFSPSNKDGTVSDKKYKGYFMALESDDDIDSYKRANYTYVSIKGGADMPTNIGGNTPLSGSSPNATYVLGGAIGRKFRDRFAVELEYTYRGNSNVTTSTSPTQPYSWKAKSNTIMLNFSADIIRGRVLRPYVKAGIGVSRNDAGTYTRSILTDTQTLTGKTSNEFAWQAGVGLNVILNKHIDTTIEYMYVDRGKIKTTSQVIQPGTPTTNETPATGRLKDNIITLGLKIKF